IGRKSGGLGSVRRARKGTRREAKRDQNASVFHESDLLRLCNGEGPGGISETETPPGKPPSPNMIVMAAIMVAIIVITFHGSFCRSGEFQDMHPGACPVC